MVTRFFREDLAGRQVFLFVTAEVLDQVASRFSLDHTDFIRAIAGEPGSIEASQVAQRAVRLCATGRWRNSPTVVYPPYVAHLCLFVYAAATDEAEDLAGHSYYPRLRRILELPENEGSLAGFQELSDRVWTDPVSYTHLPHALLEFRRCPKGLSSAPSRVDVRVFGEYSPSNIQRFHARS